MTSHRNHRFGGRGVPVPDSIRTTPILCLLKATGILLLSQTRNLGPRKKYVLPWSVAGFRAGTGTQFPNCKCFVNCTGQLVRKSPYLSWPPQPSHLTSAMAQGLYTVRMATTQGQLMFCHQWEAPMPQLGRGMAVLHMPTAPSPQLPFVVHNSLTRTSWGAAAFKNTLIFLASTAVGTSSSIAYLFLASGSGWRSWESLTVSCNTPISASIVT